MKKFLLVSVVWTFTSIGAPPTPLNPELVLNQKLSQMKQMYRAQQWPQFRKVVSSVLTTHPDHLEALQHLGAYHLRNQQLGVAQIIFDKALKKSPNSSSLLNNLGVIALKESRFDEAVFLFLKSLQHNEDNYFALLNLGSIYLKNYEFEQALPLLRRAYSLVSKNKDTMRPADYTQAMNNLAVALSWSKKYRSAKKIYDYIFENKDISVNILLNYATLLIDFLEDFQTAVKVLDKARFRDYSNRYSVRIKQLRDKVKKRLK